MCNMGFDPINDNLVVNIIHEHPIIKRRHLLVIAQLHQSAVIDKIKGNGSFKL